MELFGKKRLGYCSRCGNPVDLKKDVYCMRCGIQLQKIRKGKKLGLFKIIVILLVILAVFGAVRYYQGKTIIPDLSFFGNFTLK